MNLLDVYGFSDLSVTQKSKDGGIDGFGKLKIGLAHMSVVKDGMLALLGEKK